MIPRTLIACLAAAVLATPCLARAAGDPEAGHKVFQQTCSLCHSNVKGVVKIGPPLYGVFGRKAASYPGFNYSDALKASGKTWDAATLEQWEAGARKLVPGTKMTFPGLKEPQQIADVIAYLQTLHD